MTDREIVQGVTVNPERQGGQPCITGTRIPTWSVKSLARDGYDVASIQREYPGLSAGQIADALAFEMRPCKEKRELSRCIPASVWRDIPSAE